MNKFKNFAQENLAKITGVAMTLGFLATGLIARADVATTSDVTTAFSGLVNSLVLSIINVIVTFFTGSLPIIVILGVCIALFWYLVHKAKGSATGR